MGRYLGPILFLGISVYLLQNEGREMFIPMIDQIPGVGTTPADMQFASAVVFGTVGVVSLVSRLITQARNTDASDAE